MPIIMRVGGGGANDRRAVTVNAPKNSVVYYSGTETGYVIMGNITQATLYLKIGTYTFANTLDIDGTTTTIFTKTVAVVDSANTVNMYPDGAVYWYGMSITSSIQAGGYGTTTNEDNWVYSTYTLASSSTRYVLNRTVSTFTPTTNTTTLHVRYKVGGSTNVLGCTFYGNETVATTNPTGFASNVCVSEEIADEIIPLTANGTPLYLLSALTRTRTYSGSGTLYVWIYGVWLED